MKYEIKGKWRLGYSNPWYSGKKFGRLILFCGGFRTYQSVSDVLTPREICDALYFEIPVGIERPNKYGLTKAIDEILKKHLGKTGEFTTGWRICK